MIQKIANLFSSVDALIEKQKSHEENILELEEQIEDLQDIVAQYKDKIEHLEKCYAALTYIVESHNTLLVEMTGTSGKSVASTQNNSGLTKLPNIFSDTKIKKPN